MKLTHIAVHSFGGTNSNPLAKTSHHTEDIINAEHRRRWPNFPSKLNRSHIGYSMIIWPDGTFKQYRFLGESTAANKGWNNNTVSIALAGNFNKGAELPTLQQKMRLKTVLKALLNNSPQQAELRFLTSVQFDFDINRIHPHRWFNNTSCYGSGLSESWARDLVKESLVIAIVPTKQTLMKKILELTIIVFNLLKQLLAKKKLGNSCLDEALD